MAVAAAQQPVLAVAVARQPVLAVAMARQAMLAVEREILVELLKAELRLGASLWLSPGGERHAALWLAPGGERHLQSLMTPMGLSLMKQSADSTLLALLYWLE